MGSVSRNVWLKKSGIRQVKKDPYIIIGHGQEDLIDFNSRARIPKGYTLVILAECGIVTTGSDVCPMIEAFTEVKNKDMFENPFLHRDMLKVLLGGKDIHIYKEGNLYPKLNIQLFTDFNHGKEVTKSGTYKFPLNSADFLKGEGTFCEKFFWKLGGYKGFSEKLPDDYNAIDMFGGSIKPTLEEVQALLQVTSNSSIIKSRLTVNLEDIFRAGGPGTYYYVICRAPRGVLSPRRYVERMGNTAEFEARYAPYVNNVHWNAKIPEILPLLEENIKTHKAWAGKLAHNTAEQYKKLHKIPLIRRASINQQAAFVGGKTKRKNKKSTTKKKSNRLK
jgi:hypothetical protein